MNLDFHYYTLYFLALRAGFADADAQTLAYSSQFVDHNIISYRIDSGDNDYLIEPTQNYGFWNDSFPTEAYLPFHFFPGEQRVGSSLRVDGETNRFNTTPNGSGVKRLLVDALKTRNLFRIGIALHTYADSWAHQNFSGRLEAWNRVEKNTLIPAIGHAQMLSRPDSLAGTWRDPRLRSPDDLVSNLDRVVRAARQIYKYLATYNGRGFEDLELVEWELTDMIGPSGGETVEHSHDFIIHDSLTAYDRREWLREALILPDEEIDDSLYRGYAKVLWLRDTLLYRSSLLKKNPVRSRGSFDETRLYKWHEAAVSHRNAAKMVLAQIL